MIKNIKNKMSKLSPRRKKKATSIRASIPHHKETQGFLNDVLNYNHKISASTARHRRIWFFTGLVIGLSSVIIVVFVIGIGVYTINRLSAKSYSSGPSSNPVSSH